MRMNEVILEKRKALNMTQEQMADRLGVTAPAVHKWEKGTSIPDVAVLPSLARLLKIDLNTLFSFEKDLSDAELNLFCNDVVARIQAEGYDAGFTLAKEKIREYPNCEKLIFNLASLLDGSITIFCVEEPERYSGEIEAFYERAAKSEDEKIRNSANQLLIYKALHKKEFEKAKKLWEKLPDPVPDKKMIEATICNHQENYEEATKLLEERLYGLATELQNCLVNLMQTFEKTEKVEKMQFCAETLKRHIDNLGLWQYGKHMVDYQMAVTRDDKEGISKFSQKMLESMDEEYCLQDFLLYRELSGKKNSDMSMMRKALEKSLQKE